MAVKRCSDVDRRYFSDEHDITDLYFAREGRAVNSQLQRHISNAAFEFRSRHRINLLSCRQDLDFSDFMVICLQDARRSGPATTASAIW
jgi:hypothetical protein